MKVIIDIDDSYEEINKNILDIDLIIADSVFTIGLLKTLITSLKGDMADEDIVKELSPVMSFSPDINYIREKINRVLDQYDIKMPVDSDDPLFANLPDPVTKSDYDLPSKDIYGYPIGYPMDNTDI